MPNAAASAATSAPTTRRSETRASALPRQARGRRASGCFACIAGSPRDDGPMRGAPAFAGRPMRLAPDTRDGTGADSLPRGSRSMHLLLRIGAGDRAVDRGVALLPRDADGDRGLFAVDAAEADIAIGAVRTGRDRLAIDLRRR